ncbi:MAG: fimbrillin family protein, partial [Muribaculaceae bacterium]|nr:fimbrillin family protein [Muribaculaceae bacterium]
MKKTYLILTAGVLVALTSCTNDDTANDEPTPSVEQHAISFRSELGTRATETTNANLSSIRVSSFLGDQTLFSEVDFNRGEDSYFTSTPEYYWPGDNSTLSFVAYSPAAPGGTVSVKADSKTLTDFSPAQNIADQVDFITSSATGNKEENESAGVELVFDHRLSQININAKADNPAYVYKVTGIRIGQPVSKGSYDFDTNAWTLGSDKAIYEETYSTPVTLSATAQNIMGEEGNAILIPQTLTAWNPETDASNSSKGAYLSIKLQINTVAGAQVYPFPSEPNCVWAAIPIDTDWQAGKKYVYNLDLSNGAGFVDPNDPIPGTPVLGGPIKFTVDVKDWAPQTQDLPMKTSN